MDMVPGDDVFFIASDSPVDAGMIPERLVQRGLAGRLLTLDELPWRMSEERVASLDEALDRETGMIDTDARPSLVPQELILNADRAGERIPAGLADVLDMPPWALPAVLAVIVMAAGLAAGTKERAARAGIFITGMCGMTVQVAVMLAYQVYSGVLYYTLAIITALFMAGASLGAMLAKGGGMRISSLHLMMAGAALLVPVLMAVPIPGGAGFLAVSAAGGLLTGAYYRRVVDEAWTGEGGAPAALFYSWDMFGACAGGILAGTLLFPVSGIAWTAAAAAAAHAVSSVLIARRI